MGVSPEPNGVGEACRARLQGEVFTRRWVVELILDLAGYTEDRDLGALRAVEPACGNGAFLGPMVERLSRSCRAFGRTIAETHSCLAATDLLADNVASARQVVESVLKTHQWPSGEHCGLAETWVTHEDYLLNQPAHLRLVGSEPQQPADFVIGNPPYIRPEDVPVSLYKKYKVSYPTMCGRADVYVAFIEAALRSLGPGGVVAFICADRWMRNQYGRELRSMITSSFAVESVISLHDVDVFEEDVSAYPAIVVIRNAPQGQVAVVETESEFGQDDAPMLVTWSTGRQRSISRARFRGSKLSKWFPGGESWPGGDPAIVRMVEEINDRLPLIEDERSRTRVGIGVATGSDGVFITTDSRLIEPDRLLPLAMAADGASGVLTWSGHYLVNPWEDDGTLVQLSNYPRLRKYLEAHGQELRNRHVAKRAERNWYRTIDKVNAELTQMPKLLFPDMKMFTHPVLDPGGLYPHHNLYFVVSDTWDMEVLGGLLMSKVAEAFISAYCVKMRGGTLRFQAQYLRRIRVPSPETISEDDRKELRSAFRNRDKAAATEAAIELYRVNEYRAALNG
ncbi:MAG: Eco57I restriction-modification methylase domain-containing protein [Actinobacteria bacterium]|nr:Eco57I restriction-modification methylase domain-containing protein [Actinomycetota bacterium]MCL5445280.1 Eco57I restriction-modification methylase domain-containing protein [Actinomycetota bacterium]